MEHGYLLSEVAHAIGGTLTLAGTDERITHLAIDSRKPLPAEGTLFIALRGVHHDGHAYIASLREQGVRNVLAHADAAFDAHDLNVIRVPDTLVAMQRLCAWHRLHFHYPVIGITGSNGKTVVKEWLYQLLRTEERIVRSPGSWNSQVGVPLSVWEMGAEHSLGIFEAGISIPGEMERLAPIIAPTIGIFTNIGPAHGEHFTSDRQKAQEKAMLFAPSEAVVYCRDHAAVHDALKGSGTPERVLRDWSRHRTAFVRITQEVRDASSTYITTEIEGAPHDFRIPFSDDASVEDALHSIVALLHLGHASAWINERLAHLQPVAMRLRMMAGAGDSTLLDDSYSNDLASLGIALDHLVRLGGKRKRIVVTSDIVESAERPDALYPRMAALLKGAQVDHVYAVGTAITAHASAFGEHARFFASTEELLAHVPIDAIANAAVLVKGARSFGLERVVERWQERTHGTELRIDLDALRHNLNHYRAMLTHPPFSRSGAGRLRQSAPATARGEVKVMAMVKAFGYGSGAVELARLFENERVHYLGVAYADEGVELRQQGVRTPIMVMNPEPVPLEVLHRFQLEPEVYDLRSLRAAIAFARHTPDMPPVHLKLDTGMHRLGFAQEEIPALLEALRDLGALRIGSIFSHLAASEDPQHDTFTRGQVELFNNLATRMDEVLGYRPLRHIANSGGASRFPEARMDMVRLGIGLHGIGVDANETARLQPVATLRTVIAQEKRIPAGDSVSYGRGFVAAHDMRIAVLPIGYADGLSRRLGHGVGKVWINGQAAPFVGTICMDMCMVDITNIACAEEDEAIVFGPSHPVQEFARDLGTIPYEALTSISPRVRRVYTHG